MARRRLVVHAALLAALAVALAAPFAGVAGARAAGPAASPGPVDPAPPAVSPPRAAPPVPAPRLVWHGRRTDRVVALTFDDGYSPDRLRRIFRILEREQVPATFFVTGVFVKNDPALWREIAAAGYPLANHSYLHRDTRRLTAHEVQVDLARTQQAVERATGRPMAPLYRPPYGSRTEATDRLAADAGFPYIVMWDVTGGDTTASPTVAGVVRDATAGRPGSIVLLHAGPEVTPRALPAIIAHYRLRGFRFVTVPELLGLPADARASGGGSSAAPVPVPPAPDPSAAIPGGDDTGAPPDPGMAAPPGPSAAEPSLTGPVDAAAGSAPSPTARPAARDGAWARSDGTPVALAAGTGVGLVLLLLVAAAIGRKREPRDDPPTA